MDRTVNVLSVCFVAVENLNTTGHKQKCRTLIVKVVTAKTCIVRRDVCKGVEIILGVNLVCVLIVSVCEVVLVHTVTTVTLAVTGEGEVDHRIEAVLIVIIIRETLTEVLTCHPEILIPVCTCSGRIVCSPVLKSLCTAV